MDLDVNISRIKDFIESYDVKPQYVVVKNCVDEDYSVVWDDFVKNYNKIFNAYVFKDMFPEILIKCANNIILNLVYRDESSCYGGGLTVSIINLEYMNNIPFIDIDTLIKDLQ